MKKDVLIALALSLVLGGLAYLATESILLGAAVLACFALAGVFLFVPMLREDEAKKRKRHECYQFVHGYLITLSVCASLEKAYEVGKEHMGPEFLHLDEGLTSLSAREKTDYMASYFEMDIYSLFLSLLHLYLERGGDVLKLSGDLLQELARIEESGLAYEMEAKRNAFSFFFLWAMSLAIVIFLRFGLASFFSLLKGNIVFLGSLSLYFLFFLASVYIYLSAYTQTKMALRFPRLKKKEAFHESPLP